MIPRWRIVYAPVFALSAAALWLERVWLAFWPALSVCFAAAALAALGVFAALTPAQHLLALAAVFAAIVGVTFFFGALFRAPSRHDIDRRIETASRLKHRPLQTLRDTPAAESDALLWRQHQERAAAAARRLIPALPREGVIAQDRFRLRLAAPLCFVLALLWAQGAALPRMAALLDIDLAAATGIGTPVADAWIEPPAYTGQAPVILASSRPGAATAAANVTVPAGSVLKLRIGGYALTPRIAFNGKKLTPEAEGGRLHSLDLPLRDSGRLTAYALTGTIGRWQINVTPDHAPKAEIVSATAGARGTLQIVVKLKDDFGIEKIKATVTTEDGRLIPFDIPAPSAKEETVIHLEDLSEDDAAGSMATLSLAVTDGAGHITLSRPANIYLPLRDFTNPTAARLVQERARLLYFQDPLSQLIAFNALISIANHPAFYRGDTRVFLALLVAAKRLTYDGDAEAVASVRKLMWDIAVKIEDGGLTKTTRTLAEALQKLSETLKDQNATQQDIQQQLAALQNAMQEYLQSLISDLQQRMMLSDDLGDISPEIAAQFMQQIDIGELMEQMQRLLQGGSRDDMQKMADNLRRAVSSFDPAAMERLREAQKEAMQTLQDLKNLIEDQEALRDKTIPLPDNAAESAGLSLQQRALQDRLQGFLNRLQGLVPSIPENFTAANESMKESAAALSARKPSDAVPAMQAALDALKQGQQQASEELSQAMQQLMLSLGILPQPQNMGEGYDPLGRETGRGRADMKLPEEKERRRVQEIIHELQKRGQDYQRPRVERDYIERLLDTFN